MPRRLCAVTLRDSALLSMYSPPHFRDLAFRQVIHFEELGVLLMVTSPGVRTSPQVRTPCPECRWICFPK